MGRSSAARRDASGFQWRPYAVPLLLGGGGAAALAGGLALAPAGVPLAAAGAASLLLLDRIHPQSSFLARPLVRGPRGRKEIALTFDDGPNGATTERLLDTLKEKGVHATFFLVGQHARRDPESVRRIADEGHAIGNHTERHRKLLLLPPSEVEREIRECHATLSSILDSPPRLFRSPHGFRSPFLPRILRRHGYAFECAWTRGVFDSRADADPATLAARALWRGRDGEVLLFHDGDGVRYGADRDATVAAVPAVIDAYRGRGYGFVTLDAWVVGT